MDVVLANLEWLEEFPNMQVINLPAVGSDHYPIIVNTDYRDKKAARRFKFEVNWLSMDECEQIIRDEWNMRYEGLKIKQVLQKLNCCKSLLKEWSKKANPK